jgi:hypothetical protein
MAKETLIYEIEEDYEGNEVRTFVIHEIKRNIAASYTEKGEPVPYRDPETKADLKFRVGRAFVLKKEWEFEGSKSPTITLTLVWLKAPYRILRVQEMLSGKTINPLKFDLKRGAPTLEAVVISYLKRVIFKVDNFGKTLIAVEVL